jgi:hypothetical protein
MRRAGSIAFVVLAAGTLTACGAARKSGSHGGGRGPGQLAFAECMRSRGVSGFPDPTPPNDVPSGNYNSVFGFVLPATMNIQAPAFKSALQTCSKLILGNTARPPRRSSDSLAALRFAQCMRANGVPDYPDPPAATSGPVQSIGSGVNLDTPAAKHAASACGTGP